MLQSGEQEWLWHSMKGEKTNAYNWKHILIHILIHKNFIFLLRFSEIGDDMSMCELKVISGIVLEIDEASICRRFV